MDIKINIEKILEIYKQKVAELEHELILQKVINEALKEQINELMVHAHTHDEEGE